MTDYRRFCLEDVSIFDSGSHLDEPIATFSANLVYYITRNISVQLFDFGPVVLEDIYIFNFGDHFVKLF